MTISLTKSTNRDFGFVFSLLMNGARNGHFEPKINAKKELYRSYISEAIARETDQRGYPAHVLVAHENKDRIGAAIITTAVGTPDEGVELTMIAVRNEHRQKGFGSSILDGLLDHYLPRASVYVRCLPASEKLHQMLLRRDFAEIAHTENGVILRHGAIGTIG